MPEAPISTKMKYSGARFGSMHTAAAPTDRHSRTMNRKICRKAPEKLLIWPLTSRSTFDQQVHLIGEEATIATDVHGDPRERVCAQLLTDGLNSAPDFHGAMHIEAEHDARMLEVAVHKLE